MMTSPFSIPANARRIDPSRQRAAALKADGSVDDNDRTEIGPTPLAFAEWAALGLQAPHLPTMREYRLQRIREQLVARDLGGILLFDPLNIRYATDTTNMQLWTTHNPGPRLFRRRQRPCGAVGLPWLRSPVRAFAAGQRTAQWRFVLLFRNR